LQTLKPKAIATASRDSAEEVNEELLQPLPHKNKEVQDLILKNLPSFVYYSNYGNLDSEIYLPHVIQNLQRSDLGSREEAKARTLKVLFEFVKLRPEEILELGHDFAKGQSKLNNDEQIELISQKKKERDILLQSASTSLTKNFRSWWKQGDYRFRFQADGDHFRIWVSDDKRPEDIELEGRSTGLQWFLSFYLIFLVESQGAHQGAILLLDEPGLSLHPLAQRDLFNFFESLSVTNQILYTTHSPFLIDCNHLDRVKAVYVDENGATAISSNLRTDNNAPQAKSIYPVYASLGMSISDGLLSGCQTVIVESQSDGHYLNLIKNYLIGEGLIRPKRELLFVPAGSVKGVSAVVSILTGKEEALPFVLLDSSKAGLDLAKDLKAELYIAQPDKIVMVDEVRGIEGAEIEDLFPAKFMADVITRLLRGPEEDFSDVLIEGQPIVPQVIFYAQKHAIDLYLGWKLDLAKGAKVRIQKNINQVKTNTEIIDKWRKLFTKLDGNHS
jgi:hypothetical protein